MLRLVLFGGLRLEDADGAIEGRASQRRRLALLALLAVPPGRVVTRDKLIGFLWPDRDETRARRLLSTGLYDLREELGEEVIRSHGADVGLDPALISSDAAEFMEALEAGELERAVGLYAGPFLDGVHVGASGEFERWVDAERQRYSRKYCEALEQLATRRESGGDVRGAADAWRMLATADPCSARVALGYMTALAAAGDRARALQFFDVHVALLRGDLEAEPHPQVVELAERLREEPAGPDLVAPVHPDEPPKPVHPDAVPEPVPEPDGEQPEPEKPVTEVGDSRRPDLRDRWWRYAAIGLTLVALGLGAAVIIEWASPSPPGDSVRLGVRLFENRSTDPETGHFVTALAEQTLNTLAKVDGFRVAGWTSSSELGDSIESREMARILGVDYVVGASVQWDRDRVRAAVWMEDGRTGDQIWSETYDRGMEEIFEVQDDIARSVVASLRPLLAANQIPPSAPSRVRPATRNARAYKHYLMARALWGLRKPTESLMALRELRLAVQADPDYALAHAGIADAYNIMGGYEYGLMPPREAYPAARDAAERALRIDPDLAEAHAALGLTLFNYNWDWKGAEEALTTAIARNPSYALARHWYSLLLIATGRAHDALQQLEYAGELDPRSVVVSSNLIRHHYFRRDYALSMEESERALFLDPTHVLSHVARGMTAVQIGQYDVAMEAYRSAEALIGRPTPSVLSLRAYAHGAAGDTTMARAIYDGLRAASDTTYVGAHYLAVAALGAGLQEEAITWLEAALEERSSAVLYIHLDPVLDPIRTHPRFQRLVRHPDRAGLRGEPGAPAAVIARGVA